MESDLVLPGQPISAPKGPTAQLGRGVYARGQEIRASLLGVPQHDGSVR